MKNRIIFIALLVVLASCGATKKAIKTTETHIDSLITAKVVSEQTQKMVDTTRTEHGKVTITEIEFFPPTEIEQPQQEHNKLRDSDNKVADEPKKTQPTTNVNLENVGKVQGTVKSIKQTVIESDVEEKGKSEESSESNENESAATVNKTTGSTDKNQEPTPDPYRWRYIFFIALLGVALLLYLKKTTIVNWIRKILAVILKIL